MRIRISLPATKQARIKGGVLEQSHFDVDEGEMSPQSFNETAENKKLCGIFSLNKSPKATPRLRIFH